MTHHKLQELTFPLTVEDATTIENLACALSIEHPAQCFYCKVNIVTNEYSIDTKNGEVEELKILYSFMDGVKLPF
jgi:hypothetical protein